MDWVPLWNRTLHNRKAQSLSGDVFKTWINVLCLASINRQDGALPDAKQIAFELRLDDATAMDHLETLVDAGLLEAETGETLHAFRVHDWNAWQLTSYSSTPRVQKHREKERAKRQADKGDAPNGTGETFHGVTGNRRNVCNTIEEKRREDITPLPPTGDDVVDFGRITLKDRFDLEAIGEKLPGWRAVPYPDAWIKDAILCAKCSAKENFTASYINTCLRRWKARGGPDPDEVKKAKALPVPDYVPPVTDPRTVYGPKWQPPKERPA